MSDDTTREALEVKLAFLEHHLAELDGVVRRLHDQVDQLTLDLRQIREERRPDRENEGSITVGEDGSLPHEPPPHY